MAEGFVILSSGVFSFLTTHCYLLSLCLCSASRILHHSQHTSVSFKMSEKHCLAFVQWKKENWGGGNTLEAGTFSGILVLGERTRRSQVLSRFSFSSIEI